MSNARKNVTGTPFLTYSFLFMVAYVFIGAKIIDATTSGFDYDAAMIFYIVAPCFIYGIVFAVILIRRATKAATKAVYRKASKHMSREAAAGLAMGAGAIVGAALGDGESSFEGLDELEGLEDLDSVTETPVETNTDVEQVSGYVREDGTQVESYLRTKADGIQSNNFGKS